MIDLTCNEDRFGDVAVNLNLISREKLSRGLVVQKMIFSRTKVHMPIGKVLLEMGVLSQEQVDVILEAQKYLSTDQEEKTSTDMKESAQTSSGNALAGLKLNISDDKLSAYLSPSGVQPNGLSLESVKNFITDQGISYGLIDDQALSTYLAQNPLPGEPFKVASGMAPIEGRAPEILYHFDTDPLRVGTLKSDGTMDWKNRGKIPQVQEGDLLAEKTTGDPGLPGTNIYGQTLPAPRIREPKLKPGRGAQRSEDGRQILAKADGTPKLTSDGKIYVFTIINIDGDIGVETGNVEFEGYVEADGSVTAGYNVKAKGLRTAGIQDAVIELDEDLVCDGGIYGSTIKVGGNLKASHMHNCTVEVLGDFVVNKEVFDSTIEVNGRCFVNSGKIIASKIDAKKGIEALEIGSAASMPCRLTVGIDRKHEREMAACENELKALKSQIETISASIPEYQSQTATLQKAVTTFKKEQESYILQKSRFEAQLNGEGPNPANGDEERAMLEEMIMELVEKINEIEIKVVQRQKEETQIHEKISAAEKSLILLQENSEKYEEKMTFLDETLKVDPGTPVIKVSGTIYNKTQIIAPHKEMILSEDMNKVRITEAKIDPNSNKYQIKISNIR